MKPFKILLTEHIDVNAMKTLEEYCTITQDVNEIDVVDGMIIRAEKVTRDMIAKAKNLKVIGKHGVGYDSIDIKAAKEYGINVVYTPQANIQSVGELIIALAMNMARNVSLSFERGKQDKNKTIAPKELTGYQLSKKTFGIVGAGKISRIAATIAKQGFNMEVLAYDPYISREECDQLGIQKVDLDLLMTSADFVSISVPLTENTKHLINESKLQLMKPSAILINTSRGGVVDEEALYNALIHKHIYAAASDVFVKEPPTSENKLLSLENFVATPHIGANTHEAMALMGSTVVNEVLLVLRDEKPNYSVL
ncbi:hydroxyacid dehydrogenase [Shouchella miscanthi]|uniref:hydroxyacid dehydrogenase n=1 Tax=Shouchella miscanthi TaxID=2598861 RepID=UPI0011A78CA8|nr:hydroxyacid dehydrogenase [Shouchella miscanthi]